jgi:DNA-binding transcriptional regulator YdaS (Cro superfamily)
MTTAELRRICIGLYGDRAWQTRLAEALGVDGSTVRRWVSGAVPIPGPVAAAIACFAEKQSCRK